MNCNCDGTITPEFTIKVVGLAGQSNAVVAANTSHSPHLAIDRLIHQLSRGYSPAGKNFDYTGAPANSVILAQEALHNHFSPATDGQQLSWAIKYCQLNIAANEFYLIVPGANGGSGFGPLNLDSNEQSWRVGEYLYTDFLDRMIYALSLPNAELHSIVWHQGENDADKSLGPPPLGYYNANYDEDLDKFLLAFTDELVSEVNTISSRSDVKWVLGTLADSWVTNPSRTPEAGLIQSIIEATPTRLNVPSSMSVAVADLDAATVFDGTHFDANSVRNIIPQAYKAAFDTL